MLGHFGEPAEQLPVCFDRALEGQDAVRRTCAVFKPVSKGGIFSDDPWTSTGGDYRGGTSA